MQIHMRYKKSMMMILSLFIAVIILSPPKVAAAANAAAAAGNNAIQPIQPVPAFNAKAAVQKIDRERFDGRGVIERIDSTVVVINDKGFLPATSDVTAGFNVGDYVGYRLNKSGEIVEMQAIGAPDNK